MGKIPKSDLYIMPSVCDNRAITQRRLEELLAYVNDGAVLYVSIGNCTFRKIPEIFGVEFEYKEHLEHITMITYLPTN